MPRRIFASPPACALLALGPPYRTIARPPIGTNRHPTFSVLFLIDPCVHAPPPPCSSCWPPPRPPTRRATNNPSNASAVSDGIGDAEFGRPCSKGTARRVLLTRPTLSPSPQTAYLWPVCSARRRLGRLAPGVRPYWRASRLVRRWRRVGRRVGGPPLVRLRRRFRQQRVHHVHRHQQRCHRQLDGVRAERDVDQFDEQSGVMLFLSFDLILLRPWFIFPRDSATRDTNEYPSVYLVFGESSCFPRLRAKQPPSWSCARPATKAVARA